MVEAKIVEAKIVNVKAKILNDPPIVVQPIEAQNQIWFVKYMEKSIKVFLLLTENLGLTIMIFVQHFWIRF